MFHHWALERSSSMSPLMPRGIRWSVFKKFKPTVAQVLKGVLKCFMNAGFSFFLFGVLYNHDLEQQSTGSVYANIKALQSLKIFVVVL